MNLALRPGVVPARRPLRQSRRKVRPSAARRRSAPQPLPPGTQVDTWVLQGLIVAAMAGMLLWFHAPLGALLKATF